jgi:hypothetical protein
MTISVSESDFRDPIDLQTKALIWLDTVSNDLIGMKETVINGPEDIYKVGQIIEKERTVGATKFNNVSSRTHCLMWCKVYRIVGPDKIRINHFKVLDLAGSERVGQLEEFDNADFA